VIEVAINVVEQRNPGNFDNVFAWIVFHPTQRAISSPLLIRSRREFARHLAFSTHATR